MTIDRKHMPTLIIMSFLLILGPISGLSHAEVLHWWRFEEATFLEDSVGRATLDDSLSNSVRRTDIPRLDRNGVARGGKSFPSAFEGMGRNGSALESLDVTHSLFAPNTTTVRDDFTIELFAHVDSLSANTVTAVLATQNTFAFAPSTFSWMLQIRMDGLQGTERGELAAWNSDGSSLEFLKSGIVLNEQTDYFLAGSLDVAGGEYTFYVQDLTNDEPLQTVTLPHSINRLAQNPYFIVGGRDGFSVDGLIDEVRFSDRALSVDELLINNVVSASPVVVGDFNADKVVDLLDIDLLGQEIVAGTDNALFDLNSDAQVGQDDLNLFLGGGIITDGDKLNGDANFSGEVDFSDFLILSANFGQQAKAWSQGDFNSDGAIDFSDFLVISSNFGQRAAAKPVPEPSSSCLGLMGVLAVLFSRLAPSRTYSIMPKRNVKIGSGVSCS